MNVEIDVISDVVCPWCFIGKRNLEAALRLFAQEGGSATVHWHPFELNPDLPVEGTDRKQYLEEKFGGPERAREIYARVTAAAKSVGLELDFDRIARQPNTFDAHRMIAHAATFGRQEHLVERLFHHYFVRGTDLTVRQNLIDIAAEAGIDPQSMAEHLAGDAGAHDVRAGEVWAQRIGVQGVPFFVLGKRYALSGAQPPDLILQGLRQAAAAPAEQAQ